VQARRGEIVGVDELVAVGAVAEHDRVGAVGDPVEEDGEDAEAAVAEDRAGADDRDVEPGGGGPETRPLGGELGLAVRLLRLGDRRRQHRVRLGDAEHRARRGVHDLGHPGAGGRVEQDLGAIHVHRTEQLTVADERDLGDVVVHDVGAGDGASNGIAIADVALDGLGPEVAGPGDVDVEDPDPVAALDEPADEHPPEVAVAAGDDADGHRVTLFSCRSIWAR
jgi:hypothetical protein